jgi:hypothetical protein
VPGLTDKVECPKCHGASCRNCVNGVVEVELDAGYGTLDRLEENRKTAEPLPLGPPPKRRTCRSISVKGITYQRLKKYCDRFGTSVSGYLEAIIHDRLDALGVPEEKALDPNPPSKPAAPGPTPSQRVDL